MPPRIMCPYGEPRGAAVYCRVAGRVVNTFVFPCRSPRYTTCRFYREAEERKEREEAGEAPRPAPTSGPGAAAGGAQAGAPPSQAAEPRPQDEARAAGQAGGVAVEGWSREESERLADPLEQARILVEGVPAAGGRARVSGLQDLVRRIAERTGLSPDKCYVAVLSAGGRDVYVKICGGKLVASASREGPVEPGRLDEELRRLGEAALVVYELRGS